MTFPIHELAALGTATCWATTGILAADAIRALGAFHFNLIRQVFVTLILAIIVVASGTLALPDWPAVAVLAVSGVVGILLGDTLNFAAVGRLGPRRAGAIFALNAPMAAILGWVLLGERLGLQAWAGVALTVAGVALAILGRPASGAHRLELVRGGLWIGVLFGLGAALGQAAGTLIARPYMAGGLDPYVGSLVGLVLSVGVAIVQFWPEYWMVALVAAIFFAGQFVEGNILQPKLVGKRVGLHPVWLMFALVAFGALFGFVGLMIAVPAAAAVGVLVRFGLSRYLDSDLYYGRSKPVLLEENAPDGE